MKTKFKLLIGMTLSFGTVLNLYCQGYIVPNGLTPGYIGDWFALDVIQNPINSDSTGFFLIPQSIDTFKFDVVVDEGVRVFLVSSNDPISLQPILLHNYPELTFPNSYVFDLDSPFYVGLYTGYGPISGIYIDPLYGWAQLVNNEGIIEMLDGALEYGGPGIYAGTQTIIPEPSSISLLAVGSFLLGKRWRGIVRKS